MKQLVLSALLLVHLTSIVSSDDTWLDASCVKGGDCTLMRQQFASLVSGSECWRIHNSGACSRVCLNSLRALQSRQAWTDCARRCSWTTAFVDSARDWTDWCDSRAEPEELPSHKESLLNTSGRVTNGGNEELHGGGSGSMRIIGIVAAVALAALGIITALAIVMSKSTTVRDRAKRSFGAGPASSSSLGILGRAPDRGEMRRLAHGARRHLKAMRSNVD